VRENVISTILSQVKNSKRGAMSRLSEQTGIKRAHLYSVLSKKGNPTIETICKICDALGLEILVIRRLPTGDKLK
jgi:probable addiction module antidote protein